MSAFVVDFATIDTIVLAVRLDARGDWAPKMWRDMGADELGAALLAMNVAAVGARYGEKADMVTGTAAEPYRYPARLSEPRPAPRPAVVKALRCLLYQCTEGNVPETDLYRALDGAANDLAYAIVCEMPEYVAHPWG